ncbi:unnamed protein product [Medioppia subpectinata]|uniref:Uncharacterized protein n=1 Tax=Medioppia subpectinata TaxID=1979941 RepID=A0A7R9KFG3_9ACAR|nr:unnamed protein product [Medioppia subpectinata]CAG2102576.1 unnamed protein product [Medioppia subpectinata]
MESDLSKISAITRNLSESNSFLVSDVFKSIHDIRKSTDLKAELNKTYFCALKLDDNNSGVNTTKLNSLSDFVKNSEINPNVGHHMSVKNAVKHVLCSQTEDKCIQTDVTEFAKIKVLGENKETADDFIEYSDHFIQELEFKNSSIDSNNSRLSKNVAKELANEMQLFCRLNESIESEDEKADRDDCDEYKPFLQTNNTYNERKDQTTPNDVSRVVKPYPMGRVVESPDWDLEPRRPVPQRLILDSNIIIYEPQKCANYEVADEAFHIQYNRNCGPTPPPTMYSLMMNEMHNKSVGNKKIKDDIYIPVGCGKANIKKEMIDLTSGSDHWEYIQRVEAFTLTSFGLIFGTNANELDVNQKQLSLLFAKSQISYILLQNKRLIHAFTDDENIGRKGQGVVVSNLVHSLGLRTPFFHGVKFFNKSISSSSST